MAKLNGPLLSLSATGNIADTLNFKKWGSFSCVRFNKKPKFVPDPQTIYQVFFRDYFSDVVKVWQNLQSVDKLALDIKGEIKHQSGFNYYVRAHFFEKPTQAGVTRCGYSELGYLTF